jgi:hypothetical protein
VCAVRIHGCGTSRAIDVRTIDRHPLASVDTLVLGLRCSWCPGSAPMPKLLGLYAHRVKNSLAIVASMLQSAMRALAYPLDFNCAPQGASECA